MSSFDTWLLEKAKTFFDDGDSVEIARQAYIAGLRRAAEIARYRAEHSQDPDYCAGASGACNDIEQEATRIESEGE